MSADVRADLRADVRADLHRFLRSATRPKLSDVLRLVALDFGFQAVLVYRFGRWVRRRANAPAGWPWRVLMPISRLLSRAVGRVQGVFLDLDCDIGPGFYVGHFGGIHVSHCRIGSGCSIHQRVRIRPAPGSSVGPLIGDRVWIGCHATIEGAVQVGDGAAIAAGSVVAQDVPSRSLMLGSPARVTLRRYDNSALL